MINKENESWARGCTELISLKYELVLLQADKPIKNKDKIFQVRIWPAWSESKYINGPPKFNLIFHSKMNLYSF